MSRVTDLIKGAVELNLRYTSTLLHLSKDYLKDAGVVLTRDQPPAPAPAPDAPQRQPLLLVGRRGDTVSAAFPINNPGDKDIGVHFLVQGELGEDRVRLDPSRATLKPGATIFIRVLTSIDDKLEAERDYKGSIVAPGLSLQSGVPIIVRRLADDAASGSDDVAAKPPPDTAPRGRRAR